jgi:large subunit ribosomal protein L17
MLRNLASSLFLTERDAEFDPNPPKVRGRVTTTLQKAKEVRPLVEKCITIARRALQHEQAAEQYATDAERGSEEWRAWRKSTQWRQWCDTKAPALAARRRALQLLGDKEAVSVLFAEIAPRFADRDGGYTRVLRLAKPRLGDAGTRAILELVGKHDRVAQVSQRPVFEDQPEDQREEAIADEPSMASDDTVPEEEAAASSESEGGEQEKREEA